MLRTSFLKASANAAPPFLLLRYSQAVRPSASLSILLISRRFADINSSIVLPSACCAAMCKIVCFVHGNKSVLALRSPRRRTSRTSYALTRRACQRAVSPHTSRWSMFAPRLQSSSTAAGWFAKVAHISGVSWKLSRDSISTPSRSRSLIMSSSPWIAATWMGASPK